MKNYYFCSCLFCRIKPICHMLAGSGQFNEVLTCTNDRQGTAALLFAECLLISDWGHQHPVARTQNYYRQNTEHFEVDASEFLNSEKNGINILLGFYTLLPYVMGSSKEYMGQEMSTVPYRREKKHHLQSNIPASLSSICICGVTMTTMKTFYNIWGILQKRNSWMG